MTSPVKSPQLTNTNLMIILETGSKAGYGKDTYLELIQPNVYVPLPTDNSVQVSILWTSSSMQSQ